MKLEAEVTKQETMGDEAQVTLSNVRRVDSASWRSYFSDMKLLVSFGKLKSYAIGRKVIIEITPNRQRWAVLGQE